MADRKQIPVYFPADLYEWLQERKRAGHGSLSTQVVDCCWQARIREELAAAVAEVRPDLLEGLDRIRARIERPKDQGPGRVPSPPPGPQT